MLVNTGVMRSFLDLLEVTQTGGNWKHDRVTRWPNFYIKKQIQVSGTTGGVIRRMLPRC